MILFNSFVSFFIISGLLLSCDVYAQTAEDYLDRGNAYYKQSYYAKAVSDYTKAIDIDPNITKAYNNRGVIYAELGYLTESIADFTMAIANNPNDAEAYNNRGHSYAKQGNLSDSIADFTHAIQINPNYTKAYINRALSWYNTKEYTKAWLDVYKAEELGGTINPNFLEDLKKASDQASNK
ncbi:MAG: tetratricopeptide repeat protein [Candidatus Omnitrophica bacterium]|nr:tetratricopeptide repeat protein [Candidatus Omnitrophota bacterium]